MDYLTYITFFLRLEHFSSFTFAIYSATEKTAELHALFLPDGWSLVENLIEIISYGQKFLDQNKAHEILIWSCF